MTIRRVRIWLSRGWCRTLCSISLLLLPLFCKTGRAFAAISHVQQDTIKSAVVVSGTKPKSGDIISGTICNENGPMQLVNITERDSLYRIVAHAVSDVNGKFAFKLVNPANRLSVTYVGYGEAITAITGTSFDVTMVELPDNSDLIHVEMDLPNHQLAKGRYKLSFSIGYFDFNNPIRDLDIVGDAVHFEINYKDESHNHMFTRWNHGMIAFASSIPIVSPIKKQ